MTPNSVLIIENEATTVTMVERSLQNEGYTIIKATDAESGFALAKETIPSIILLNLAVEGSNGLEICKTIHTTDELKDIPMILLTLREGKFDPIYTKLYGIVNFLKKPFTPEQLLESVREFAPFQAGEREPTSEPVQEFPTVEDIEEETPVYAGIDEPIEPSEPEELETDAYSIDEDISLEDVQASMELPEESPAGFDTDSIEESYSGLSDESEGMEQFAQESFGVEEEQAYTGGIPELEEPSTAEQELPSFDENSFEMPTEEPAPQNEVPFEMPAEEPALQDEVPFEMPAEEPAPQDEVPFEMPPEEPAPQAKPASRESDINEMDFDLPSESVAPRPSPKPRVAGKAKAPSKGQAVKKKKVSSRENKPKSSKTLVVLLVLLLVVLAGAAFSAYYFFLREPVQEIAEAPVTSVIPAQPEQPGQPVGQPSQPVTAPVQPEAQRPVDVPKPPAPPKPAPAPEPAMQKPTPPKPPPPKRPPPTAGSSQVQGRYTVQFGVFSTNGNAEDYIGRLKAKGLDVVVHRKKVSGRNLYYVLLRNGFGSKDAASDKAQSINRSTGFATTVHKL